MKKKECECEDCEEDRLMIKKGETAKEDSTKPSPLQGRKLARNSVPDGKTISTQEPLPSSFSTDKQVINQAKKSLDSMTTKAYQKKIKPFTAFSFAEKVAQDIEEIKAQAREGYVPIGQVNRMIYDACKKTLKKEQERVRKAINRCKTCPDCGAENKPRCVQVLELKRILRLK